MKTFNSVKVTWIMKKGEKRIWESRFYFLKMTQFTESNVLVLAEGGGCCFNVLFWENFRHKL